LIRVVPILQTAAVASSDAHTSIDGDIAHLHALCRAETARITRAAYFDYMDVQCFDPAAKSSCGYSGYSRERYNDYYGDYVSVRSTDKVWLDQEADITACRYCSLLHEVLECLCFRTWRTLINGTKGDWGPKSLFITPQRCKQLHLLTQQQERDSLQENVIVNLLKASETREAHQARESREAVSDAVKEVF